MNTTETAPEPIVPAAQRDAWDIDEAQRLLVEAAEKRSTAFLNARIAARAREWDLVRPDKAA